MIPFKESYYQNKIDEFKSKFENDRDREYENLKLIWEIKIDKRLMGYMHAYKGDLYYSPHLYREDELVMAVDGEEVGGLYEIVKKAHGRVGIVGLGLGYSALEMAKKEKVHEIVVYERDPNVIQFFKDNIGEDPKIKIVNCDAFKAEEESFDYFFVDIYDRKLPEKIYDDYVKFKNIHKIKDYVFFGVDKFILSLIPQKYDSEKIFKLWKDMAQNSGERFSQSRYCENFGGFSFKKVNALYDKFGF